jgi:hypothetical protein
MLGSASPSRFQYVSFGDNDLERVDVINDHGVLIDSKMTFVNHIESIVSKSARMLVFIKRISRRFTCKTMYVPFVRSGLSMHCACARLIRRFIRQGLNAFNTII